MIIMKPEITTFKVGQVVTAWAVFWSNRKGWFYPSAKQIQLWLKKFATVLVFLFVYLADRTNGRAYATVLRLSSSVVCTECIVAKRCVLEQKLPLTAYGKSYYEKSVPKWKTLTFV